MMKKNKGDVKKSPNLRLGIGTRKPSSILHISAGEKKLEEFLVFQSERDSDNSYFNNYPDDSYGKLSSRSM